LGGQPDQRAERRPVATGVYGDDRAGHRSPDPGCRHPPNPRAEGRVGRGKVVAIIEIVSPGNKASRHATRSFVEKAADILSQGVNLLIVDLFPPTPRDPLGIHKAIWDELDDEPFEMPAGKPLIVASYIGGDIPTAYVESVGVGDPLPSLPIFLSDTRYIPAPLEPTYQEAWRVFPAMLKELIDPTGAG
jgi:hypothetical protein